MPDFAAELTPEALDRQLQSAELWHALLAITRPDAAAGRAIELGEPAYLAKSAFQLAQAFSNFYHNYPVIHEEDRERKTFLLWMTYLFGCQLQKTLGVLGIPVPASM